MKQGRISHFDDDIVEWYKDDMLHREDGPAVFTYAGTQVWYQHGLRHREDGPAIITNSGEPQWWLNDRRVSKDEHKLLTSKFWQELVK